MVTAAILAESSSLSTVSWAASSALAPDGTLAGSVLRLNRAVRNFAADTEVSVREVVQAATLVPARLLGLARKGRIAVGCDADLMVLDRDDRIGLTVARGAIAHSRIA